MVISIWKLLAWSQNVVIKSYNTCHGLISQQNSEFRDEEWSYMREQWQKQSESLTGRKSRKFAGFWPHSCKSARLLQNCWKTSWFTQICRNLVEILHFCVTHANLRDLHCLLQNYGSTANLQIDIYLFKKVVCHFYTSLGFWAVLRLTKISEAQKQWPCPSNYSVAQAAGPCKDGTESSVDNPVHVYDTHI